MMADMQIPEAFAPLLTERWRYKFYYGGRGGGKSYAFADSLALLGAQKKIFVACLREIQDSIKDSVYKLLCERIELYQLPGYRFYEDRIDNVKTGSRFIFKGLRDQNSQNIKSLEGVDYCWIEEGQTITRKSWDILNPTIRKDGSEIWISMNREEETDALWVALAANPDERTLVRKVNYYDNPFCPRELKQQAEKCRREDYESYLHVWEGDPLPQGALKLISSADVHRALAFKIDNANNTLPLVVGVDVARFGDDRTAICRRRGRQAYRMQTYKHLDTVAVANLIVRIIREEKPVRVNIDAGQNGAGVIDLLIDRGYQEVVREVNFGSNAQDTERYANRRAEMWGRLNDWLKTESGVSLTDMPGILEDLTAVNKEFDNRGRLMLEKKEKIKKRLGFRRIWAMRWR